MIDPGHELDDPTQASWAGTYFKPFPQDRPYYWTGISGGHPWNYADPRQTWEHASDVCHVRVQTLLDKRPAMYAALLAKVKGLYGEENADVVPLESQVLPQFDGRSPLVMEAETSEYSGKCAVAEGDSGTAWVEMRGKGAVNWVFQSSLDPGPEKLVVRYRVPKGSTSHRWFINGALMGSRTFTKSGEESWQDAPFEVHLEKGRNSFVIVREGAAIDLDRLAVGVK